MSKVSKRPTVKGITREATELFEHIQDGQLTFNCPESKQCVRRLFEQAGITPPPELQAERKDVSITCIVYGVPTDEPVHDIYPDKIKVTIDGTEYDADFEDIDSY